MGLPTSASVAELGPRMVRCAGASEILHPISAGPVFLWQRSQVQAGHTVEIRDGDEPTTNIMAPKKLTDGESIPFWALISSNW